MKTLLILVAFLIFLSPVEAAIIEVCSTCSQTTVQGGINLASNGDEVRITDSREYNETVIVNRSVNLSSNAYPVSNHHPTQRRH